MWNTTVKNKAHEARIRGELAQKVVATVAALERGEQGPLSPLQILDGESLYMVSIENEDLMYHRPGQVGIADIRTCARQIRERTHAVASTEDIQRSENRDAAERVKHIAADARSNSKILTVVTPLTPKDAR